MKHLRLAEGEYRFARIVWNNEPLPSGKLVELSQKELGWKKSTTYTVLKKLVDRGVLRNENAMVSAVIPQEDILREESHAVVNRAFDGSLPSFLAHFMEGKTISNAEADALNALIDQYREGNCHD